MSWKNDKGWVYSITYDEGCADLLKYALPLHRKYGIPGHVALVASQVGVLRDVPGSSYDGMMILTKQEIEMLCNEGWGVSCHSMSHKAFNDSNKYSEVVESRKLLEKKLDMTVKMFCVCSDNTNYPPARELAQEAGYNSIMTITDDINTKQTDLLKLNRCPVHTEYPPPFYSVFDPYKRIHQAIEHQGWIIDYCHCPTPGKAIHPWKDCSLEELEERFKKVVEVGGDDVWLAEPTDVVNYLLEEKT